MCDISGTTLWPRSASSLNIYCLSSLLRRHIFALYLLPQFLNSFSISDFISFFQIMFNLVFIYMLSVSCKIVHQCNAWCTIVQYCGLSSVKMASIFSRKVSCFGLRSFVSPETNSSKSVITKVNTCLFWNMFSFNSHVKELNCNKL